MKRSRILLADDHRMVAEGLRSLIELLPIWSGIAVKHGTVSEKSLLFPFPDLVILRVPFHFHQLLT